MKDLETLNRKELHKEIEERTSYLNELIGDEKFELRFPRSKSASIGHLEWIEEQINQAWKQIEANKYPMGKTYHAPKLSNPRTQLITLSLVASLTKVLVTAIGGYAATVSSCFAENMGTNRSVAIAASWGQYEKQFLLNLTKNETLYWGHAFVALNIDWLDLRRQFYVYLTA